MVSKTIFVVLLLVSIFVSINAENSSECYAPMDGMYKNYWYYGITPHIKNCSYITSYCNDKLHAVECVVNTTGIYNFSSIKGSMIYPGGFIPQRCALLHEPFKFDNIHKYTLLCSEKTLPFPPFLIMVCISVFLTIFLIVSVFCITLQWQDQMIEDWHDITRFFKARFHRNSIRPYEGQV
jgi:hypothetical protein